MIQVRRIINVKKFINKRSYFTTMMNGCQTISHQNSFKHYYVCYVDSNIPTPKSKFLREKCNANTGVLFVANVRRRYVSAFVFTSGLCDTFTSSKLISSASFVKSHNLIVQSNEPEKNNRLDN